MFFVAVGASTSMPRGVNFGGWLCLEDWFFSGDGGVHVSTPNEESQGQGACLPPVAVQLPEHWPSEGKLVKMLNASKGPEQTSLIFEAHRENFIQTTDLENIASLGMKHVRVPLTWAAFADALAPIDETLYGSHDAEWSTSLVPDPYYHDEIAMATIPRGWLKEFLEKAGNHGIQVLLDLHAFPGGSSDGTYNGIWPLSPVFWHSQVKVGDQNTSLQDAGLMIVQSLISWVEGLDGVARDAVGGVTIMNEPAHLSFGKGFADEAATLAWLAKGSEFFRKSALPSRGVKLYMNLIETAFEQDTFWDKVPSWWRNSFSSAESNTWAVIDMHWYSAWGGASCSGRTSSGGAYLCNGSISEIQQIQHSCISEFTNTFKQHFLGLKATSEFSIGTFDKATEACTAKNVLDSFLDVQVQAFEAAQIESYFWTWKMPYGRTFEPGWSLKFATGLEDTERSPCLQPLREATSVELVV